MLLHLGPFITFKPSTTLKQILNQRSPQITMLALPITTPISFLVKTALPTGCFLI